MYKTPEKIDYDSFINTKINKLSILSIVRGKKGGTKYICECECGVVKEYLALNVVKEKTLSCGCTRIETKKKSGLYHGLIKHPLYTVWYNMKDRCSNENCKHYKWYGGKGIHVCSEWIKFINFYDWCMNNGWKEGLQIDRFPNQNGHYEPSNYRFVTSKVNNRNRSSNKIIKYNNQEKCLSEWCEIYNLNFGTVWTRLNSYPSITPKELFKPVKEKKLKDDLRVCNTSI